jgi:hypothetical protein
MLLPGSGFVTTTLKLPAAAVPVAVRRVLDTKAVAKGEPASSTTAPLAKPLPFTVIEKLPVATNVGAMLANSGVGFHNVTMLCPTALESAALTALTVTVFVLGTTAGAV